MSTDFLSILDFSNSTKNAETNETVITVTTIEKDETLEINSSITVTSNCETVIKCRCFKILSADVSLSNIKFECSVEAIEANNFTMKNCTITKAQKSDGSLKVHDCQNVTLSYITITESIKIPGLYLNKDSIVAADNLHIHDIDEDLITCRYSSILSLKDSKLHGSQSNGVFANGQSSIQISNCQISDTYFPAINISNSQCNIENSEIEGIAQNAINISNCKDFVVKNNSVKNSDGSGIEICEESVGEVNGNKITAVKGNGIFITTRSTVECRGNEISGLSYPGIAITNASTASLFENVISRIEYSGIAARNAKSVRVEGSTISDVGQSGVSVSDTAECVVEGNELARCAITGVESFNGSRAVVRGNAMREMGKYAFLAYTSGTIDASGNRIDGVGVAMAKLAYRGGGEFVGNELRGCAQQCEVKAAAPFFMSGNGNLPGATNDASRVTESVVLKEADEGDCGKCLKCGVGGRDFYLLECGHRVYCRECAEAALRAKEACPLCRFPIVNVTSGFSASEDGTCVVCAERKADCIILPCGHIGVCSECLENWFKNKQSCPICREENSYYKKIIVD